MSRLRFGIFLAPFHPAGENPTLALERDLELDRASRPDRVRRGVDRRAPLGRQRDHRVAGDLHRGGGRAHENIKLGTGVVSVAYHNPLWVTERIVLLDHLTRGRVMFGVGPGSLPTDSAMIGLNPTDTRELLEVEPRHRHAAAARREPVTAKTATHKLVDARLHLRAVLGCCSTSRSPRSPRPPARGWPGSYGVGLLSIGATLTADGFDALAHHWNVMEERAQTFGTHGRPRRSGGWSATIHIAETREQAYRDVEFGIEQWFRYFQKIAAFPQMAVEGGDVTRDDRLRQRGGHRRDRHRRGRGARRCRSSSTSPAGFGCMLVLGYEWANPQATWRSWELLAQHVLPEFQGQAQPTLDAKARAAEARTGHTEQQHAAIAHMTEKYQREVASG